MQAEPDDLRSGIARRLETLRQKVGRFPNDAPLRNEIGVALAADGRIADALAAFTQATELAAGFAEAWFNTGLALELLQRNAEAFDAMVTACCLAPNYRAARMKAQELARATGKRLPRDPWERKTGLKWLTSLSRRSHKNGTSLPSWESDAPSTEIDFRAAIAHAPDHAEPAIAFGRWLWRKARLVDAELFLSHALRLSPGDERAALALGDILERTHRPLEALAVLEAIGKADAASVTVLTERVRLKMLTCSWHGFDTAVQRALDGVRREPGGCNPYFVKLLPTTLAEQQACAAAFAAKVKSKVSAMAPALVTRSRRAINIGYLSAEFHQHAGATLMSELIELHDRRRFHVSGYPVWLDDGSAYRARLRKAFDRWGEFYGLSGATAAKQIRGDAIDILIDLSGYTNNGRPDIVAHRPAPIQVNYLGYPGTMGADFVDYIVVDTIVAPSSDAAWYNERLVHMPNTYQVNDRKRALPAKPGARSDHGLPDSGTVFCNFNDHTRITPAMFALWMEILRRTQGSVLWLLAGHPSAQDNLRCEAARLDVAPDRLVFAGSTSYENHLARYWHADLFLDTLPYNAHTTCSEALWMGCPVLTCRGDTFAGRVASSLVQAAEIPDLTFPTLEQYQAKAVHLGQNGNELRNLRNRIRDGRRHCPLFDSTAFTRALESAYEVMFERLLANEVPQTIAVSAPSRT